MHPFDAIYCAVPFRLESFSLTVVKEMISAHAQKGADLRTDVLRSFSTMPRQQSSPVRNVWKLILPPSIISLWSGLPSLKLPAVVETCSVVA